MFDDSTSGRWGGTVSAGGGGDGMARIPPRVETRARQQRAYGEAAGSGVTTGQGGGGVVGRAPAGRRQRKRNAALTTLFSARGQRRRQFVYHWRGTGPRNGGTGGGIFIIANTVTVSAASRATAMGHAANISYGGGGGGAGGSVLIGRTAPPWGLTESRRGKGLQDDDGQWQRRRRCRRIRIEADTKSAARIPTRAPYPSSGSRAAFRSTRTTGCGDGRRVVKRLRFSVNEG
jgi:hypothetical protein